MTISTCTRHTVVVFCAKNLQFPSRVLFSSQVLTFQIREGDCFDKLIFFEFYIVVDSRCVLVAVCRLFSKVATFVFLYLDRCANYDATKYKSSHVVNFPDEYMDFSVSIVISFVFSS